jgi:catechol 2,3-dioxygenase-like lactoylglutathione lyase family enzyme
VKRTHQEKLAESSPLLVELHVSDLGSAGEFYSQLGFREVRRESRYLVLKRGGAVLHFYLSNDCFARHHYFGDSVSGERPLGKGVELVVFVSELSEVFAVFEERGSVVERIRDRPWGVRDFRITDPFGYYLRISEPYDTLVDWTEARSIEDVEV